MDEQIILVLNIYIYASIVCIMMHDVSRLNILLHLESSEVDLLFFCDCLSSFTFFFVFFLVNDLKTNGNFNIEFFVQRKNA